MGKLHRRRVLRLMVSVGSGLAAHNVVGEQGATKHQPPAATSSGFVDSAGFKVYFETFGDGDPIVLVHGWGSSITANWVRTGWVDALRTARRDGITVMVWTALC